ncbi:MAG: hypothetical protein EOO77_15715 [Oxalobacteraceae bacterium]|nr:MAG: hypothetical protein EOO77_15715 [Oxalobacteraceae bacterium]
MSLKSILNSIGRVIGKVFNIKTADAVLAFVAKHLPTFGPDLAAFSATLPGEFASLDKLADEAIRLFKAAKGVKLSKSLAIALAQAAYTAYKDDIQAEAEKLLAK